MTTIERINQLKGRSVKEVHTGIGEIKHSFPESDIRNRFPFYVLQTLLSGIKEEAIMLDTFKATSFSIKNKENLPEPKIMKGTGCKYNRYNFEKYILIAGEIFGNRVLLLFEKK